MMQPGFTLAPRDPFTDVKETLSSWDNCMAKDYCKWPVIVAIILGSLIALSVVFCIARCICCGAECAMCCCRCCTCCGGSSDSGHRRMKSENQGYPPQPYPQQPYSASANPYAEARSFAPPPPPQNTQYQSHATPTFNPQTNPNFAPTEQPQYATFDARSQPVNDDALPAMPSWNNARSVQVPIGDEAVPEKRGDVEMDRLYNNPPNAAAGVAVGAAGAGMRGSPGGRSPVSPLHGDDAYSQYDRPAQYQNIPPTYAAQDYNRGPSPAQSYSQYSQASDPYDRRSPVQNQPYTTPLPYQPPAERFHSPAPPSYHTTAANPYAYDQPPARSHAAAYDPIPNRSQAASPNAYPGQQTYQAFQPQGPAIARKPVEGSARDV